MRRQDFYYQLPSHLIAQYPLEERTASRLLCLDGKTGALKDRHFVDLVDLLNPGDLLVFNNTRVIPARLFGRKYTGGQVEILVERIVEGNQILAHLRVSKPPKAGSAIALDGGGVELIVVERHGDLYRLVCRSDQSIQMILEQFGRVPLPPYIDRDVVAADTQRYQTVYAQQDGAVAAPTAGLHFDDILLQRLRKKGVKMEFVTLHVGSGTFQPVRVENVADHEMHSEYVEVGAAVCDQVAATRENGHRVVAVGTTSLRCLEAAFQDNELRPYAGDTSIFIYPGVPVRSVDALITNFHLPESTLLMLVCAFAGYDKVMQAYQHAIAQQYRFYSYGDAMFIERENV